jgi:hypothetical protein
MSKERFEDTRTLVKANILARSIKEDQAFVATQWLKTFKHNEITDPATSISKLMLACIAIGDFKTRSSLVSKELTNPPATLAAIDYLSHASRIIIDYQNLSETDKAEFLKFFPKAGENGVVSRSATHAVVRQDKEITELKGFMLGVVGQLPTMIKAAYDFGVNIAMGGEGETNLVGKRVTANGFSGHLYFHHNDAEKLMMVGLEQSAPATSILEAIWGHTPTDKDVQEESDQFGQGHSLTGASDTYTAAGSLYFSDPVYQSKLLCETKTATPDKYGAMQITLTDDNWKSIKAYLLELNDHQEKGQDALILKKLLTPPSTAKDETQAITSYIALDFRAYLKEIAILLDEIPLEKRSEIKTKQLEFQQNLLGHISELQAGNVDVYESFLNSIKSICSVPDTPTAYIRAISRIGDLFTLQQEFDPKLKQTHLDYLVQQEITEALNRITILQEKSKILKDYFSTDHISKENGVGVFLSKLEEQNRILAAIKKELLNDSGQTIEKSSEPRSLTDSALLQSTLESGWLDMSPVTMSQLQGHQNTIDSIDLFLNNTPRLVSESTFLKVKQVNIELLSEIQSQQDALEKQKQEISEKAKKILKLENDIKEMGESHEQENKKLMEGLEELKKAHQWMIKIIEESEKTIEENEKTIEENEKTIDQLALDAKKLTQSLEEEKSAHLLALQNVRALEETNQQINSSLKQLQQQFIDQARDLKTISQELEEKIQQLKTVQEENSLLGEQITLLTNQNKQQTTEIERLKKIVETQTTDNTQEASPWLQDALVNMALIYSHLKAIEEHGASLSKRGYTRETDVAKELVKAIRQEMATYLKDSNQHPKQALEAFKQSCQTHISQATPVLEVHRGWKRLLGNLLACILGLGVGYVVAGTMNYFKTGNFLFFNETASMQKVNALNTSLDDFAKQEEKQPRFNPNNA